MFAAMCLLILLLTKIADQVPPDAPQQGNRFDIANCRIAHHPFKQPKGWGRVGQQTQPAGDCA